MNTIQNQHKITQALAELKDEQAKIKSVLCNRQCNKELTSKEWDALETRKDTLDELINTLDGLEDNYQVLFDTRTLADKAKANI